MQSKAMSLVGITVVCIVSSALSALFLMYAFSPWIDHNEIPFFGSRLRDTTVFSILGASGISVTVGLARGKRWALWSALIVVGLMLSTAVVLLVATVRPRDDFARSEGGFAVFLSFCLLVPGLVSGVLLLLPAVRQRFSRPH
jgi:hypothetical protein